jgi:translation initiation factor 1
MAKKRPGKDCIIFSTDPNFSWDSNGLGSQDSIEPAKQRLRVRKDAKNRAGKMATLVEGFVGKAEDLEELGKKLKTYCGTGGSVKDGIILIQGDQRVKAIQWLVQNGYQHTKS